MATPDREPLTCEPATDAQRAEARERVREQMAEAERRHGPDYYAQLRERFGVTEHRAA